MKNQATVKFQIVHRTPERLRVRVPRLQYDPDYASILAGLAGALEGVTQVRLNAAASCIVVHCGAGRSSQSIEAPVAACIQQACDAASSDPPAENLAEKPAAPSAQVQLAPESDSHVSDGYVSNGYVSEQVGATLGETVGQRVGGTIGELLLGAGGMAIGAKVGAFLGEELGGNMGEQSTHSLPVTPDQAADSPEAMSELVAKIEHEALLSAGKLVGFGLGEVVGEVVGGVVGGVLLGPVGMVVGAELGTVLGASVGKEVASSLEQNLESQMPVHQPEVG